MSILQFQILNARNSPPKEGWIRLKGEDGVVIQKKLNFILSLTQMTEKQILTQIDGIIIYRNFVENLPYNPSLKQLAREKRKLGILSEVLFWKQVRNFTFHNIDFDRQRIIGNYIVDFYVKALGLVVEIDGSSHDSKQEYDLERTQFLENLGLKVFRITDWDVKQNLSIAMKELEDFIVNNFSF